MHKFTRRHQLLELSLHEPQAPIRRAIRAVHAGDALRGAFDRRCSQLIAKPASPELAPQLPIYRGASPPDADYLSCSNQQPSVSVTTVVKDRPMFIAGISTLASRSSRRSNSRKMCASASCGRHGEKPCTGGIPSSIDSLSRGRCRWPAPPSKGQCNPRTQMVRASRMT